MPSRKRRPEELEQGVTEVGFVYIWMYQVREGRELDFEGLYGQSGGWTRLFRKSAQYLGTELLRDRHRKGCYLTVDRWVSEASHREFVSGHEEEFAQLEREGERLTLKETGIGDFDVVGAEG